MSTETFDAIVVGAGQAGPAIAARCSREGLRTAIIERHLFGGTCVNTGCIPTKTLVASARAIALARRGDEFGFRTGPLAVDMARVMARKDAIVQQSRGNVEKWMRGLERTEVVVGHARFSAPGTLQVGARTLAAPKIFLNVGARAQRPALDGIDDVPTLNNVSILELKEIPEHLVMVGGSYIGLEFAQMYRRFGSAVTIIDRNSRLIKREDHDVSDAIKEIVENEGIAVRLNAECMTMESRGAQVAVKLDCASGDNEIVGSHLLLAAGQLRSATLGEVAQAYQIEGPAHLLGNVFFSHTTHPQAVGHVIKHCHVRPDGVRLEDHRHATFFRGDIGTLG